ncbi:MAG: protein kinase [Caldilineaceae bacterium]|nr:protein kinase [Caldilineaceae bacterium]
MEILGATPTETTEISSGADLSTSTLELDPTDTVMAGSPIGIAVIVRNTGSTAAEGVIVTLESDPRLHYLYLAATSIMALPSAPAIEGGLSYRLLGAVVPGAEVPLWLSGTIAPDTSGDLQVKGLITTPEGLEVPVENTVQVEPSLQQIAVDIEGPDNATTGEELSFLIKVSNTGSVPAENVRVEVSTSPAVTLEVVDSGSVNSVQTDDNRLVLEFADIAPGDGAEVTLTGVAPTGPVPLLVDVATQDAGLFDPQSVLTKSLSIPLTPPPPTATPEPVITEPPPTAEPTPSSTPTPVKTEVVPPAQPPDNGTTSLLVIGIVALLAVIVIAIMLILLLNRTNASPTMPLASGKAPPPQVPLLPGQQVVFDSSADAAHMLGATYAVIPTGTVLEGRYRILSSLGAGGFGAVYLAEDTRLSGKRVAVKETLDSTSVGLSQFQREAAMLATLTHENLPRVTDYFSESSSRHFLVMDFVDGEDLQAMVDRLGPLRPLDVQRWILQVLDALAFLHEQPQPVVHRDIKPANIRISADGRSGNLGKDRAVLVDFGIAKIYLADKQTTVGARAVTPGYSPPEQYGVGRTDPRSDIYALGATAYKLLTGVTPVQSVERLAGLPLAHLRHINGTVSAEWEAVVLTAMELDVRKRYQSAEAMRMALSRISGAGQPANASGGTTVCTDCGVENRSAARFCKVCGTSLHADP